MGHGVASSHIFRFGLFEADAARSTLTRNGVRVKIQDQPFRVLILLLQRPGDIVSREELRQALWPEGTFVDFDGSLNVILKKLRAAIDDNSDNPRFIETVPRRGYRFIAPISTNGDAQPSSSSPAATPPPETSAAIAVPLPNTFRALKMSYVVLAGIVLLLIAAILSFSVIRKLAAREPATPPVSMRKAVAILGFRSTSGNAGDAWLATAFSEMLSTELASGERLRLVSGEDVSNLRLSSPWSQTDTLDQATTSRIGTALNSDLIVLGSYTIIGSQLRLDVRLQDARTGEILTEVGETGGTQNLFGVVSRVGARLRDRLGIPRLEQTDETEVLASLPSDPQAARLYALGITKLRQFDPAAAKDLLKQAADADPKFPLAHLMLARAWGQLGYEQKRREETKRALDLSTGLPRLDQMEIQGAFYESVGKHEQAASIYHALFELYPDNVDFGLRYVTEQDYAGHQSQALEAIRQLRNLPLPASGDPRIDLAESGAIKNNKPSQLALVRSAMSKATAQGKNLLYAEARKTECLLLGYSEHPEQSTAACEEAYEIYMAAGNRLGAADAVRLIGDHIGSVGHYEEAIATYQRALNMLEGTGEHEKTGAILNNMAINFENEGKLEQSEQLYRQAKVHFEQAGDKFNSSTALCNIADILYLRGNLPEAAKLYKQTLDLTATLDRDDPGYTLYRLADLELAQGNVKDAYRHAQQGLESLRPAEGGYQYITGAMIVVGEALKAQGDLQGARKQFQETLEIRQKMGEMDLVAESQVELADLALVENHPQQAEALLRPAIAKFEEEKGDPDAAAAYTLLSRVLLLEGKVEEARKAIARALELSATSSDPALKLAAAIQNSRIEKAQADPRAIAAARQDLRSTISTARKLGYYTLDCEARLALGELELKANPRLGRSQLKALAAEIRSRSLELLARQAEQAVNQSGNVVAENKPSK